MLIRRPKNDDKTTKKRRLDYQKTFPTLWQREKELFLIYWKIWTVKLLYKLDAYFFTSYEIIYQMTAINPNYIVIWIEEPYSLIYLKFIYSYAGSIILFIC